MIWLYAGFIGFVVLMLTLDLGVFHRKAHVVSVKEALAWSAVWITLGLSFSVFVYFGYEGRWFGLGTRVDAVDGLVSGGGTATHKYLTGYIIEESLSVDNLFVIALMFGYFGVPAIYRHRVLFWGILGAVVMRGAMIAIGAKLVSTFHWVLYVFGVFLIVTAIKMLTMKSEHKDPTRNLVVRLARRWFPVTTRFHGEHFVVRAGTLASHKGEQPGGPIEPDEMVDRARPGTLLLTPLALALAVIESTDLVFAVDSIPAIFAVTADPFLVFTSNVFAVLGLRSLFFALAGMIDKFRYLKVSLALVLMVVGVKMLVAERLKAVLGERFNFYLLAVVFLIFAAGVAASLIADHRRRTRPTVGPHKL